MVSTGWGTEKGGSAVQDRLQLHRESKAGLLVGVVTHAFKLSTQKTEAGDFCEFKIGPVSHLKNKTENKTKIPLSPTK